MSKARQSTRQRYRGTRLDMRKGGRVGFAGPSGTGPAEGEAERREREENIEKNVGWYPFKYLKKIGGALVPDFVKGAGNLVSEIGSELGSVDRSGQGHSGAQASGPDAKGHNTRRYVPAQQVDYGTPNPNRPTGGVQGPRGSVGSLEDAGARYYGAGMRQGASAIGHMAGRSYNPEAFIRGGAGVRQVGGGISTSDKIVDSQGNIIAGQADIRGAGEGINVPANQQIKDSDPTVTQTGGDPGGDDGGEVDVVTGRLISDIAVGEQMTTADGREVWWNGTTWAPLHGTQGGDQGGDDGSETSTSTQQSSGRPSKIIDPTSDNPMVSLTADQGLTDVGARKQRITKDYDKAVTSALAGEMPESARLPDIQAERTVAVLDEEGNQVIGDDGKPVMRTIPATKLGYSSSSDILADRDAQGNVIAGTGDPVSMSDTKTIQVQAQDPNTGKPMVNADGTPVMVDKVVSAFDAQGSQIAEGSPETVQQSLRQVVKDGVPQFDAENQPIMELDYAAAADPTTGKTATTATKVVPVLDDEGNPVTDPETGEIITETVLDVSKVAEDATVTAATRTKQVVDKDPVTGNPIILPDGTTKMKTVADIAPDAQVAVGDVSVTKTGDVAGATVADEYTSETMDADGDYTNKALVDRVTGTVSAAAKADAVAVAGLSERKITRYKKQLRNAGLSEGEITELKNDPEALEERVLDFTEEQRGVIEGLPEEALVSTQIEGLLEGMEEGKIPMWANPAVSAVNQMLAERGLSASTVGRDNLFNAIVQSAMPIAQSNAQAIQASVAQTKNIEAQEAMQNAQMAQEKAMQNASVTFQMDMANFNAEQQAAVANSKFFQTVALTETNNAQQAAIQEAILASQENLAEADLKTKARINNANSFLQMDMANLSNQQQSKMLEAQIENQRMLSNQSAENAMRQLNVTETNRVDMFMTNIEKEISMTNAAAANNMTQFNLNSQNAANARDADREFDRRKANAAMAQDIEKFNSEVEFRRSSWNAQNAAAVQAADVAYHRKTNEINTATQNAINMQNSMNSFKLSTQSLAFLNQEMRDQADYAFKAHEAKEQRIASVIVAALGAGSETYQKSEWRQGLISNINKLIGHL